jgi:hypothetical protein
VLFRSFNPDAAHKTEQGQKDHGEFPIGSVVEEDETC